MGFLLKISGAGNRFLLVDQKWFQGEKIPENWENHSHPTKLKFEDFTALSESDLRQRKKLLNDFLSHHFLNLTDGLIVLREKTIRKTTNTNTVSEIEKVLICDFYNKDGSKADMCGNAACCLAFYFNRLGLNVKEFVLGNQKVRLDLNRAVLLDKPKKEPLLVMDPFPFYFIDTGVPHGVIPCDKIHYPSIRNLSNPSIKNLNNPSIKNLSNPSIKNLSNPSIKNLSNPSIKNLSNPSIKNLNNPSIKNLSNPSIKNLSNPSIKNLNNPSIKNLNNPSIKSLNSMKKRVQALRFKNIPPYKEGMNVSFYQVLSSYHLKAITFERGVEDFTLACGTGALAVSLIHNHKSNLEKESLVKKTISNKDSSFKKQNSFIKVEMPGGDLEVEIGEQLKLTSQVKKGF